MLSRSKLFFGVLTVALAGALASQVSAQQAARAPLPTTCPIDFKSPAIKQHMDRARTLLGADLPQYLLPGLSLAPRLSGYCAPPGVAPYDFDSSLLRPSQAFDQLFWVGSSSVGVWALKTSDGIIMFDAMNTSDDAEKIVEPGLRQLGLDPSTIKYILVTHGHGDHWGGSKYFQDKYGTKVLLGSGDQNLSPSRGAQPPRVDQVITDGMDLRLGSTTVRLFVVSGHTPGSIGAIFPVTDRGVAHTVGLFGGFGLPTTLDPRPGTSGLLQLERSIQRFKEAGVAAGVDSTISTHPFFDDTLVKVKRVANGRPQTSPWVIGKAGWPRFMDAFQENARALEAMIREHPPQPRPAPAGD